MKIFLVMVTLTFLASCTPIGDKSSTMKDDKMMSGTWSKEDMEAMEKDHMMMSGTDMKDVSTKMDTMKKDTMKKDIMMKPTGYVVYDAGSVASALKSWQKVVLFFHAAWCPTCKALNSTINSELSLIPADTLIVKVDYDSSDVLKQKYGVAQQHTTVVLNADGTLKSKKVGAKNVAEILN